MPYLDQRLSFCIVSILIAGLLAPTGAPILIMCYLQQQQQADFSYFQPINVIDDTLSRLNSINAKEVTRVECQMSNVEG